MKMQLHCMYFAIICICCIIDVSSEHAVAKDMLEHEEDDGMLESKCLENINLYDVTAQ